MTHVPPTNGQPTNGQPTNGQPTNGQPTPPTDDASTTANEAATPPTVSAPTSTETETTPPGEAFAELGLSEMTLRAIADLGYGEPTPIQGQSIPILLSGRDVIAQAPTGTGKTAAYGLPIIERLDESVLAPQALIVVPTRELAIQVAEALHSFGRYRQAITLPIYGGAPYERQFRALARGVQIIVGTPGRLLDHLRRETLVLGQVRTVVLDEADEMLDMGFIEDIEAMLAALPEQRQSALFSATIPPRIAHLAEQYLREPARLSVATREAVAPRVRQVYYEVPHTAKPEALSRILDLEQPDSAIVFVRTRNDADEVAERLNGLGYLAQAIHGEVSQSQRERVLGRFRAGHTQLLVATDVAARGLDIPDVSHIINYDLPLDAEWYVHRIGRTGRAGRGGEALTLVTPRERRQLRVIEQAIHRRLERLRLPTRADVAARRRAAFREEVLDILDAGSLDPFLALVEDLADTHNPAELAAAAFKMAAQARESRRPGYSDLWNEPEPAPEAPTEAAPEAVAFQAERPERPPRERGRREVGREGAGRGFEGRGFDGRPRRGTTDGALARLFLRVGRRDGARPADLVGAIANEAGIPGDAIGDIDIYDTFSFVEVPESEVEAVRAALNRTTIRGRAPRATLARPDEDWRERAEESHPPRREPPFRREAPRPRDTERHPYAAGRSGRRFEREDDSPRRPLRGPNAGRRLPLPRKPAGYPTGGRPSPRGRRD